jgi:hypothetical protein
MTTKIIVGPKVFFGKVNDYKLDLQISTGEEDHDET